MHRRRVLSLVATTPLVAGCSTGLPIGNASESTPTESTPTGNASESTPTGNGGVLDSRRPPRRDELLSEPRPPAEEPIDATGETVATLQYPTKPASYTSQSVQSFVEDHERAYRRNELLGKHGGDLVSHGLQFDWTVALDASDDAGVGRCQYSYTTTTERSDSDDAGPIIGDSPTYVVTYYVDDSTTVRAEGSRARDQRDELTPDPWEAGVVLEPTG